jgi:amino acid transporter
MEGDAPAPVNQGVTSKTPSNPRLIGDFLAVILPIVDFTLEMGSALPRGWFAYLVSVVLSAVISLIVYRSVYRLLSKIIRKPVVTIPISLLVAFFVAIIVTVIVVVPLSMFK